MRRLALAAAIALAPAAATAHPHVFIDGGLDFLFDAEGRLEALRVTWIYDPLTSLFILEDLEIAAEDDAGLSERDRGRLAAYQTEWLDGFEGDSYLWDAATRIDLSGPRAPQAEIADGRVVIRFLRDVATPFRPGADTVAEIYDPTYYAAYLVTETPRLEGGAAGCAAEVKPFEPSTGLATLQQNLLALPADATPEQQDVGALFAERIFVACD